MASQSSAAVVWVSRLVIFAILYVLTGYVAIVPFLVSKGQVGIILSTQAWSSVAALIPAGFGIDKYGAKGVLQLGVCMSLTSLALMGISSGFPTQLLARILLGAATSVIFNSAMALIMEHFMEPKRSEHLGLAVGLGSLGNLAGPPCMGALFDAAGTEGLPEPQLWAVLPPLLLFFVILKMLQEVVSKTDPLLEKGNLLAKACGGLFLFGNAKVLVLTFELICIFAANNAFVTAAAIELQRHGFSSTWIGVITMPSGLMQCLLSQWAGRVAGSAKNRERILLYTPALLGFSLLFISFMASSMAYLATVDSSVSTTSTLLVPILSTLIVSSAALGAADAPAMSMMADLAASQGLGYGQALTASEMAINAGLAMGPSLATLALAVRWNYFEICLTGAVCTLLAAFFSTCALRDVPHADST
ncbi:slc18a3a [Symbiodinium pilosum]|uniref:Slc18a3a protein n=1 Tax=Symbiodinium pilosum TaxID=2952 RepID=A0A812Y183_SYMPI|nr:slc18a3a [Symbiodinium pilosum]